MGADLSSYPWSGKEIPTMEGGEARAAVSCWWFFGSATENRMPKSQALLVEALARNVSASALCWIRSRLLSLAVTRNAAAGRLRC